LVGVIINTMTTYDGDLIYIPCNTCKSLIQKNKCQEHFIRECESPNPNLNLNLFSQHIKHSRERLLKETSWNISQNYDTQSDRSSNSVDSQDSEGSSTHSSSSGNSVDDIIQKGYYKNRKYVMPSVIHKNGDANYEEIREDICKNMCDINTSNKLERQNDKHYQCEIDKFIALKNILPKCHFTNESNNSETIANFVYNIINIKIRATSDFSQE